MLFKKCFILLFKKVLWCNVNVKIILNILYFELFVNVFIYLFLCNIKNKRGPEILICLIEKIHTNPI
jgi:hypothetical protein